MTKSRQALAALLAAVLVAFAARAFLTDGEDARDGGPAALTGTSGAAPAQVPPKPARRQEIQPPEDPDAPAPGPVDVRRCAASDPSAAAASAKPHMRGSDIAGRAVRRDGTPFRGLVAVDRHDPGVSAFEDTAGWLSPVETAQDGAFTLRGVSPGLRRLVALVPGRSAVCGPRFLVPAERDVVFVVDGATVTVTGRVVDAASGNAVAGALVEAPQRANEGEGSAAAAVAGRDGSFRIEVPAPIRELAATAPGWTRAVVRLGLPDAGSAAAGAAADPPPAPAPVTIRLVRGARVAGRVTDAAGGAPIAGVRVLAVPLGAFRGEHESARTDADGRYAIEGLAAGTWTVFIYDDGSADASSPAAWVSEGAVKLEDDGDANALAVTLAASETRVVDLAAVRCAQVRGTVVEEGDKPVPGIQVGASPSERLWDGLEDRPARATTAADGSFVLTVLPFRAQTVHARWTEHYSATAGVGPQQPGATAEVRIVFPRPSWTDFVVRGDDGAPVPGARIYMRTGSHLVWVQGEFRTGADGRIRAGPTAKAETTAWVSADGYLDASLDVKTGEDAPVEVVLRRGATIRGSVTLPEGVRPTGTPVVVSVSRPMDEKGRGEIQRVVAADDLRFRTRALEPGTYRLTAKLSAGGRRFVGTVDAEARDAETGGAHAVVETVVALLPVAGDAPRTWRMRVVDPGGRPVARADAIVAPAGEPSRFHGIPSRVEDGLATAEVPAGTASVVVRVSGAAGEDGAALDLADQVFGPFDVAAGDGLVRLSPGFRVAGVVRHADGSPVRGIAVRARPTASVPGRTALDQSWAGAALGGSFDGFSAEVRTGADGRFELRSLAPGEHQVLAQAPRGMTVNQPVVAAGTRDVVLVVGSGVDTKVRVLDWEGKPVPGATLRVFRSPNDRSAIVLAEGTDNEGFVTASKLAPGSPYFLEIQPPWARLDLRLLQDMAWVPKDGDIRLERDFVLAARVTDAQGRAVEKIQVWTRGAQGTWVSAVTDGGGHCNIGHLPAAEADVVLLRDGSPADEGGASVNGSATRVAIDEGPVTLRYDPGPTIRVFVERTEATTWDNAGMSQLWRAILVEGDGPHGAFAGALTINHDTFGVFDRLRAGTRYSLWVFADPDVRQWGLDGASAFVTGLTPGAAEVRVKPSLDAGKTLEGRITRKDGALPPKIRVTAHLGALRCRAEVTDDRFVFRGLVEGTWTVEATAQDGGKTLRGAAAANAGGRVDVELK